MVSEAKLGEGNYRLLSPTHKIMLTKQPPTKCPKCLQQTLYHNKGVSSKTNKPYENNKCAKCDYLIWIPQEDAKPVFNKDNPPGQNGNTIIADLLTQIDMKVTRLEGKFDKFLNDSQLGVDYDDQSPL